MRLAIPVWNNKVSPVLDTANRLLVVEVQGCKEVSRFETFLGEQGFLYRCFRLHAMGVDLLICGALTRAFQENLKSNGIEVVQGVSGEAEKVLGAYLDGSLMQSDLFMPGFKPVGDAPSRP